CLCVLLRHSTLDPYTTLFRPDQGAGEPVVLVHDTPSSSNEWRYIIPTLAAHYRVLAPDLLGFGASSRPADLRIYTRPWHTQNLHAWLAALELSTFHLVVHDFGGPVALPLALEQPEIGRAHV